MLEFASLRGKKEEFARGGIEGFSTETDGAFMRREVPYFLFFDIEQVNVTVRCSMRPVQCNPALIAADGPKIEPLMILVQQGSRKSLGVITVYIEEPGIALVGGDVKSMSIGAPAHELGLELFPRGQIFLLAVWGKQEQMIIFIAMVIPCDQHSIIVRKEADRKCGIDGGAGQWLGHAPCHREGIGIENA